MSLEHEAALLKRTVTDDAVREIHMLTARLRAEYGELDDDAIQAVSEATGAPEDFVRLAARSIPNEEKQTLLERVKSAFLAFDPALRRLTMAGVLAAACGLSIALGAAVRDSSGFMGTVALLSMAGAVWNSAVAKDTKTALLTGSVFGALSFIIMTFFTFLVRMLPNVGVSGPPPGFLILWIVFGGFFGVLANSIFSANRSKLGLRDPAKERHELLQQLQDIQDKLKSDERFVTFLSVDIVGSTPIKSENDTLMVEFTFNEYHKYVQSVVERYGGKVHSTAGDGVTCVFESPQMGYAAGRAILAGLFEFNTYRNKLSKPIEVRAGVHTGSAHLPGQSLTSVNFSHVIDVSAHMQKAADPGTLVVSEKTAQYVPGGMDAIGGNRINIHDIGAVVWRPKVAMTSPVLAVPEL